MALQAEVGFAGLSSSEGYWRLAEFQWNSAEPFTARMRLDGYASEQAYLDGLPFIASVYRLVHLPLNDLNDPKTLVFNQIRTMCYQEAKRATELEGAVDV
jgi:hypothetical protein